jgi:hypothetical protein
MANGEWRVADIGVCVICNFSTAVLLALAERGECSAAGVCNATELARHGMPLCVPGSNHVRHEQLLCCSAQRSFRCQCKAGNGEVFARARHVCV